MGTPILVILELDSARTGLAFDAMRELRPHVGSVDAFVDCVNGELRSEGYRLVGSFSDISEQAISVAGFQVARSLAWGRYLYVHDLSTVRSGRRGGHARRLLAWLVAEARRLGCDSVHLDSGRGPKREAAHRLYVASGFEPAAEHYALDLLDVRE